MNQLSLQPLEKPITASVEIPGSKSYTNRALIMAAMTDGPVLIENPLESDDTDAMITCLNTLGITVTKEKNRLIVSGSIKDVQDKDYLLDANLSGTTIRFILALSTIIPGTKTIYGGEGLNKRPIAELIHGLKQLGAVIEYTNNEGFPPLRVTSSHLKSGTTRLKGDISSQYFSAIMMIAPQVGGLTIEVEGEQISKSYIDMTIDSMAQFGVTVTNDTYRRYIINDGQQYRKNRYIVEGDFSGAGYFFAIAALTQSTITLKNLNPRSKQGDIKFVHILEQMGNKISAGPNRLTIHGNEVRPLKKVDMASCPDQAQTLAVLAAFADGITTITGIKSLRIKETERVKAIETELAKMGIKTKSTEDTLIVYGGNPKPAVIDTYGDHRMAMAFAVAGTKLHGMTINNPHVVTKTFPTFWEKLISLGIQVI